MRDPPDRWCLAVEQPDDTPTVARELNAALSGFSLRFRLGITAERQGIGDNRFQRAVVDNDIADGHDCPMRRREFVDWRNFDHPNLPRLKLRQMDGFITRGFRAA